MAKGSDNPYPSVLLVEQGSAPASPSSGQQRLYLKTSDHLPYLVNSAGGVSAVGGGGGGSGAWTHLAETIVAGSVAASITLSSISGSYRHLVATVLGQGDSTAGVGATFLNMQFNGDTGSNYDYNANDFTVSATDGAQGYGQTSLSLHYFNNASGSAFPTGVTFWIYDYARTVWNKMVAAHGVMAYQSSTPGMRPKLGAGMWKSTAAITSITVFPSGGNFDIGTCVSLWGVL